LGIFAAFFYSVYAIVRNSDHFYFDTACSLVALVLVGKFIESSARQKASGNIHRLYQMMPNKVRLVAPEGPRLVAIEKLQAGDHFIVKAGEKIPADGRIVDGRAIVDESLLTGESKPIEKRSGDMITGSTMLLNGFLEAEVLRIGEQTVLASIIKMVETALATKSPLERLVDRLARVFIPLVLVLAAATAAFLLVAGASLEEALLRGITVMVIACPCALGMATPLAIAAGIGYAARRGILIRDGAALQLAGKVSTVVFDKTGTLTEGKFTVLHFNSSGFDEDEALRFVGSLEQASNHPLAVAIVEACKEKQLELYEAKGVQLVEGMGISGTVMVAEHLKRVVAGNETFVSEQGFMIPRDQRELVEREAERGRTVVFFGIEGHPGAGYLVLGDSLKPDVPQVVAELHKLGASVRLLSGDAKLTTAAVAQQAGITDYTAQALPQDKILAIRNLQSRDQLVAMVGDGVNDAPALAQADVGIAMGSGTEIAIASGAITMMREDLSLVPEAIQLSRRAVRTIKQNLTWAFFYNSIGIIIAIAGWLNPLMAVSAMLVSSLSVVGNSMRLHEGKGKTLEKVVKILVPWREPEGKQSITK
ncbi:MAG: heavy metal translocating P-type ATPase, partial [candidate division KSB1 bacterium]|nr:heavy metal translocating P-type ATPase [candidate division KSB1 bacterium]